MMDDAKIPQFSCDDCNLDFSDYIQFLLHRKCHSKLIRSVITKECLLKETCPLCFVKHFYTYKTRGLGELLGSGRTLKGCGQGTKAKKVIQCKYYPKCKAVFYRFNGIKKHAREVHNDDKPYACRQCNYATSRHYYLMEHLLIHVEAKMFKCHLCVKEYRRKEGLKYHLLSNHNEANIKCRSCSQCGKKFYSPAEFKRHVRRHLPTLGSFKCLLCPKEYNFKESLANHVKSHYNMFKCHLCAKEYKRKQSLKYHLLMTHEDGSVKSQDCSYCGKKFAIKSELKLHLRRHLPTTETFKCHLCPRTYSYKDSLRVHLTRHYKVFNCHLCPKQYATKKHLKSHLLSSHKEVNIKSHDCSHCDKKFPTLGELLTHSVTHLPTSGTTRGATAELFKCHLCPMEYSYKKNFEDHMQRHNNSHKNLDAFICGICTMRFSSEKGLKSHKSAHAKKELYSCDYCDKKFFKSSQCKKHRLVHLEKEPHDCKECGQQFVLKASLKKHLDPEKESKNILCCKKCPKTFKNLNCFTYHDRSHREFVCEVCKKKCCTPYGLKMHLEAHGITINADSCSKRINPDRSLSSQNKIKCSLCPKEYRSKHAFERHLQQHEGKEPYVCKHCGKRFTVETYLKAHLNPEKETKNPLSCKDCSETFSNINCLAHHKRSHMEDFSCEVCKVKCFTQTGIERHLAKHGIKSNLPL